ncbi:hypothetical protein [Anaeromyxobacter oryzae]|uniref:Uncharacterized protein n=1 Tax=Anaeromyxobacter oryzae TaxID=2918170 RepID=A0ABN6MLI1_9BACT|nr:hypothetical protein [Anaeromyxobacter oryzae]BDG01879.1 hypothetical protein AMOR_08750 [Anaeromyxobacter oryzae]
MQRALASVLVLFSLFSAAPAAAALFKATTVEEAARTSDAVVRGTVLRKTSRFAPGSDRIVTDVDIAVTSTWKGAAGKTVTVTVPGGVVGDLGQYVDAAPTFEVGEDVVVFLARRPGAWGVNGLALGKWTVAGTSAQPAVHQEDMRPEALRAGEALIAPTSVADLERRVRGAR